MRDVADILPELLALNRAAEAGPLLSTKEIEVRCNAYEKKMIDRSFAWVAKSGGTTQPVSRRLSFPVVQDRACSDCVKDRRPRWISRQYYILLGGLAVTCSNYLVQGFEKS